MRVNVVDGTPVENVVGGVGIVRSVAVDGAGLSCGQQAESEVTRPPDLRRWRIGLWTRKK
jgi:hypothetical protein